ncbi:hypothetical protein CDL15_Pgr010453 [Punica granatum]|uniref:Uncharacterized protein n=1 Tax=Punica granatum TaxID=22663 RepID=A0A218VW41_PUNGR|nr:hypothetical protein CDL15_Pgr010453 [Punica granatum]
MLDVPHRLLGGDGSIVVFTRDAPFACKCCRKVALLWIDSALGTVTHLVLVKSENCGWFTLKGERDSPLVVRMEIRVARATRGEFLYRRCEWDPVFESLDKRPPGASTGHAWAYRDVLNDALAALLVVRRARQPRTLLVRAL